MGSINEKLMINDMLFTSMGKVRRDTIGMKGLMKIVLFNKFGNFKDGREVHNTVTVLAHQMAADQLLASPSVAKPGWMEVGTGSGQAANSTTLATYIAGSRTALDSKTRGANAIVTMVCTFAAGVGTGAITEAGIFNVATENTTNLITYADFAAVNKAADDSLVITWTLTFS